MCTKIKELIREQGPIIFLLLFYTVFHVALSPGYWDDASFRDSVGGSIDNLIPLLWTRYQIWSPRVVIEFVIGILSLCPYVVWKVCNLLIILLLYTDMEWFLKQIFLISDRKMKWGLALLLCALPFSIMASTGWLATTTNYLWVVSLGWYAVNKVLKYTVLEEDLSLTEKIFMIPAVLYSANFESIALLMLVGLVIAVLYERYGKYENTRSGGMFLWVILAVVIVLFIVSMACPGNKIRLERDTAVWLPDYNQMNLLDKLRMGIITAYMNFVSIPSPVFFILNGGCLVAAILKKSGRQQTVIAAVPVLLDICWTCYYMLSYLSGKKTMTYQIPNALLRGGTDMTEQIIMLITVILWFASLLYTLYGVLETKRDFFICLTVLLVGCVPEVVVGMSPTVVTSMLRTVLYLYLSMIILILCLWKACRSFWNTYKWLRIVICFVIIAGIALNALQMTRHILIYG